jgi:hypothetical protein
MWYGDPLVTTQDWGNLDSGRWPGSVLGNDLWQRASVEVVQLILLSSWFRHKYHLKHCFKDLERGCWKVSCGEMESRMGGVKRHTRTHWDLELFRPPEHNTLYSFFMYWSNKILEYRVSSLRKLLCVCVYEFLEKDLSHSRVRQD